MTRLITLDTYNDALCIRGANCIETNMSEPHRVITRCIMVGKPWYKQLFRNLPDAGVVSLYTNTFHTQTDKTSLRRVVNRARISGTIHTDERWWAAVRLRLDARFAERQHER